MTNFGFQYSFLLIHRDKRGLAGGVLLLSNVYHNQRAQDTLRLALIGKHTSNTIRRLVAHPSLWPVLSIREIKAVAEHGCKIIFAYRFNNDPIRILLAVLASGYRQLDAFIRIHVPESHAP